MTRPLPRKTGRVVLWGGRRGDVHYNSRDYWRRNIPIDPAVGRLTVDSAAYLDIGQVLTFTGAPDLVTVAGIEGHIVGVRS